MKMGSNYLVRTNLSGEYPHNFQAANTTTPDSGPSDSGTTVSNNRVGTTVDTGKPSSGNNSVDSDNAHLCGFVSDVKSHPIPGTPITLADSHCDSDLPIATGIDGTHVFRNLEPGPFTRITSNSLPNNAGNLIDATDTRDPLKATANVIGVALNPGNNGVGGHFVDTDNDSLSGLVTDDNGKPQIGVFLKLLKPDGRILASPMTTDSKDTVIGVSLAPGRHDSRNKFGESSTESIGGTVTDKVGVSLKNLTLNMPSHDRSTVTVTTSNGDRRSSTRQQFFDQDILSWTQQ